MTDETANDILDRGREYAGGHPPATIRFAGKDVPNPTADAPPQAYLGLEQMAWFKERLRNPRAPWKIWGHSFGTMTWRMDPQNLPARCARTGRATATRCSMPDTRSSMARSSISCARRASPALPSSPATSIRSGQAIRARRCRRSRSIRLASNSSRGRSPRRGLPRSPRPSSRRIIRCVRSTFTTRPMARRSAR